MKPHSTKEAYWRELGYECREFTSRSGKAMKAKRFTRLQSNKAMRTQGKRECREGRP